MARRIKLYGERNTNTNYMSKLFELNLDADEVRGVAPPAVRFLQRLLLENEVIPDLYFALTKNWNLGWKHSCVPPPEKLKKRRLVKQGVAIITITKNPYSWLLSLFRNPHHQYDSNATSFENFLDRPWKTMRRDNTPRILDSPVELWNLKNRSYARLSELGALSITTEQIFADPERVIETISQHFAINRRTGEFRDYERSTKDNTKDRTYYRDYYLNEKWKQEISRDASEKINASLDKSVVANFGYSLL